MTKEKEILIYEAAKERMLQLLETCNEPKQVSDICAAAYELEYSIRMALAHVASKNDAPRPLDSATDAAADLPDKVIPLPTPGTTEGATAPVSAESEKPDAPEAEKPEASAPSGDESAMTKVEVRSKLTAMAPKVNVYAIMNDMGYENLSSIPASLYGELLTRVTKAYTAAGGK